MNKSYLFLFFLFTPSFFLHAQLAGDTITEKETSRIIHVLASDSLKGRGNLQPGLLRAGKFIGEEFRKSGLHPLPGFPGYFLPFNPGKEQPEKDADKAPDSILLTALPAYSELEYNVIGILPGRSKADEAVLFSAHYDHMGVVSRRRSKKDSIMNGANDNASGTTALLMLAHYFAKRNDNQRTLIFCAFAGEELGLKGSKNFMQYINPDKIVAGINIEMIGIPQYGKRTVFITGEEYSALPGILKRNFRNNLRFVREPDPVYKQLFSRSDNYSFVRKGIPSHSIMASDDSDKCYHAVCDDVKRIDIPNMTAIIRGIAAATATLISGEETPERINYKF
jgi:hypothetical protein